MLLELFGFPKSRPHVSRFLAVLTAAMARNRGRTARGNATVRNSEMPETGAGGAGEADGTGDRGGRGDARGGAEPAAVGMARFG